MIKIGEVIINNSISKNVYRIVYVFSIILICALLYISLKGIICVHILKQYKLTEAIVTRNLHTPKTSPDSTEENYRVEFKYIVDSKEYIVKEDLGDKIVKYNIGEKIKIYYDNNNINVAQIYRIAYFPLILALFLIFLSTLMIIKSEKR